MSDIAGPKPDSQLLRSASSPPANPAPSGSSVLQDVKSAAANNDPLHGITLQAIVAALSTYYGWDELGQRIPIRCFQSEPSVLSSLKFLRKTPWARDKVESLYLFMLRDLKRAAPTVHNFPPRRAPTTGD